MAKTALTRPKVAIIMGSDSDFPVMEDAVQMLREFGVAHEVKIISAHRTPTEMAKFAQGASRRGIQVIIAGAGGAAHLPGMVAAHSELPVIGVPVPIGALQGQDALLSIVQMPKGVPVATVAIGNATNAALLAIQILAFGGARVDARLGARLKAHKASMRKSVLSKKLVSRRINAR
jgi:phosphoribosylaminoimidazole carboxylase PurE protein